MATQAKTMPKFKSKHALESKQRRYGYLFCLPFIIGALVFVLYPLVLSVLYSFSDVMVENQKGLVMRNWGFQNYDEIFNVDVTFRENILDSLGNMAINVPVVVIFAFFMASVLNTKFLGRVFARSIMFLPVIISTGVVVSLSSGDLAASLMSAGDRFAASDSADAIQVTQTFENMLLQMGLGTGFVDFIIGAVGRISEITNLSAVSIVIFIAGLQSISTSIYEAAYIEGATKWEVFWKISLPMISPLILLSIVYTVVDSFTSDSNAVIYQIHQQILGGVNDVASAMAVVYSLIILAILGVVFLILSKIVFYQD